jgi:hypothetical protein
MTRYLVKEREDMRGQNLPNTPWLTSVIALIFGLALPTGCVKQPDEPRVRSTPTLSLVDAERVHGALIKFAKDHSLWVIYQGQLGPMQIAGMEIDHIPGVWAIYEYPPTALLPESDRLLLFGLVESSRAPVPHRLLSPEGNRSVDVFLPRGVSLDDRIRPLERTIRAFLSEVILDSHI